ncbi:MAG TPA: hypothetical protein RMH99_06535 [Sandaracinaceae bacterium LLY-WYZ-13_1]|nr:hypothetical protein [Sandaracinaceae bacterium LLY-WYZ-13_1]
MTRVRRCVVGWLAAAVLLASCDGASPSGEAQEEPGAEGAEAGDDKPDELPPADLRIGQVMVEVGHRFEISGRAAEAGRWELAQYEAHEILEVFDSDMRRALLPGDCDDAVADRMYETLRSDQLADLRDAAGEGDAEAYAARYRTVSGSCNGCHAACEVSFVQVPAEPGHEVPDLSPVGAAAIDPEATSPAPEPRPDDGERPPSRIDPDDPAIIDVH